MDINRYLIVGKLPRQKASARLSVNKPALSSHEVAVRLSLSLPDELFSKPQLQASITVPKDAVSAPVIDAGVVDNIQEVVSKELGVDLSISVVSSSEN